MEPKAPDTRTLLLQAALVCFADHGFDGTSMRMIAEKAGRPLSLLSHYFGNKEGLYLEVFKHLFESAAPRALQTVPPEGLDPRNPQKAICLLREQIHFMYQEAAPDAAWAKPFQDHRARLWMSEFRSPRLSLHPFIHQYLSPTADLIAACIRVLRPDLSAAQVAFLGTTIMGQVSGHGTMSGLNRVLWGDHPPFGSHFQEAELLVDFCLHGLRADAPIA
ncbi:TetR/AcrR family transcriptional regulator [Geothrix sp. 21YS21S-4]|uniref:TetR/AcrR family transcriptional regulator n=1 Tax=Geothrix sp. 21YS21S-4 TaxID=3068889 RepID=UPI0027B8A3B2|nr:TetR/AcrR family transcriptional regulator [Geothrix sp. 21YS21S-4]